MGSTHIGYGGFSSFTGDDFSSDHRSDLLGPLVSVSPHLLYQQPPGPKDHLYHQEQVVAYDKRRDSTRQASVPVQEVVDEILWSQQQSRFRAENTKFSLDQDSQGPTSCKVDFNKQTVHSPAGSSGDAAHHSGDLGVKKRRRGRPRLYNCTDDMRKSGIPSNDVSVLREYNLEKNRVAAEKCRLRRKKFTTALAADFDVLSKKNEALKADASNLREELLFLKNKVLSHAGCGSPIIDGYIAKSAGSQLDAQLPSQGRALRRDSGQTRAAVDHDRILGSPEPKTSESPPDQDGLDFHPDTKTLDPYWLMNDTENMNEDWY